MIKPPKDLLTEVLSISIPEISSDQRDEMAIPSYMHSNPAIRWLMWKRYEVISNFFPLEKVDNILEFGCGIGLFLPEIDRHAKNLYAIDLFPQYAIKLCSLLQLNVNFLNSVAQIKDDSLDVVVVADVLEHVDNLDETLLDFFQKLSFGGRLLISGPTENIVYRFGRFLAGFSGKADYHQTNIHNILQAAVQCGFTEIKTTCLPFRLMPPLFKICVLEKR